MGSPVADGILQGWAHCVGLQVFAALVLLMVATEMRTARIYHTGLAVTVNA